VGILLLLLFGGAALAVVASSSSSDNDDDDNANDFIPINPRFLMAAGTRGPNVGHVDPSGLTPGQKAVIDEQGRKAQAEFEKQKKAFVDRAKTYGEALGGDEGGAFMEILGKISVALVGAGPEEWFTEEQFNRANDDVIEMLKHGLRPLAYDNDLYAGYAGWADDMEKKLSGFDHLAPGIQNTWVAYSAWMYEHPEISDPAGFPWNIFAFIRNDDQLAAFGRSYAQFLGGNASLQSQYAAQAVRIGKWLRATEPYRFTTAQDYMMSIMILLDNIDQPTF
jgi:hypothetical protein